MACSVWPEALGQASRWSLIIFPCCSSELPTAVLEAVLWLIICLPNCAACLKTLVEPIIKINVFFLQDFLSLSALYSCLARDISTAVDSLCIWTDHRHL